MKAGADPLIPDRRGVTVLEAMAKSVECDFLIIGGDLWDRKMSRRSMIRIIQNTLLKVPEVRQNISETEARLLPLESALRAFLKFGDMDSIQNFIETLEKLSLAKKKINSPLIERRYVKKLG